MVVTILPYLCQLNDPMQMKATKLDPDWLNLHKSASIRPVATDHPAVYL
jgi:hypothetical protein